MAGGDCHQGDGVRVVRWVAADIEPMPLDIELSSDDSVDTILAVLASKLHAVRICCWMTCAAPSDECGVRAVSELVRNLSSSSNGLVSTVNLRVALAALLLGPFSKSFDKSCHLRPVVTSAEADAMVSKEIRRPGAVLSFPLGKRGGALLLPPNPFVLTSYSSEAAVGSSNKWTPQSGLLERRNGTTIEALAWPSFMGCAQVGVEVGVATIDDVRRLFGPSDPQFLAHYLPAQEELLPGPGPGLTSLPSAMSSPTVRVNVRSLHLVLEDRAMTSLFTQMHGGAFREALRSLAVSPGAANAFRLIERSAGGGGPAKSVFKLSKELSEQMGNEEVVRALNAGTSKLHAQELTATAWRPSGCWAASAAVSFNGSSSYELRLLKGTAVSLAIAEQELGAVHSNMLVTIAKAIRPHVAPPCFDSQRFVQSPAASCPTHRLISAVYSWVFPTQGSSPTTDELVTWLSDPARLAYVANADKVGASVVCQYKRVDGYVPLTPAQQTLSLNSSTPPHVLIGLLIEKHGMSRGEAQQLIDEEYSRRENVQKERDTRAPVFIVLKPVLNIGVAVTVRGPCPMPVVSRIGSLVAAAVQEFSTPLANQQGPPSSDVVEPDVDLDLEDMYADDAPQELREALAGYAHADAQVKVKENDEVKGDDIPGRYVISELHRADAKLFDTGTKEKRYSRICGHVVLRQPVRISPDEELRIERDFPGALTGSVSTGSTALALAENRYVCPKVWCPKSRVAMTLEQYEAHGRKCPHPDIREEALVFDDKSYWNGRERYPGLLDPRFHPDGLCMPCCFLMPHRGKNKKCRKPKAAEPTQDVEESQGGKDHNVRYIYGDGSALPADRYGFLPDALHAILNAGSACSHTSATHVINRMACVLRKGVSSGQRNVYDCFATVLGASRRTMKGADLPKLVREHLEPVTFLALHAGAVARRFMPPSLTSALANPVDVESFTAWFSSAAAEGHVRLSGLEGIRGVVASGSFAASAVRGEVLSSGHEMLQAAREYALFLSMRAYLDALDVTRHHDLLLDLVNLAPPWLNPEGVYVIVMSKDETDFVLSCPVSGSAPATGVKNVAFLVQRNDHYEALCTVTGVRGGVEESFAFDAERTPGVRGVLAALTSACKSMDSTAAASTRALSLVRGLHHIGEGIVGQIVDYSLRCVGFISSSAGAIIPLERPDSIVVSQPIRVIFLEDAIRNIPAKPNTVRESSIIDLFRRLAQTLGDPAYDVARVVQFKTGGRALLLAMGRTSPLTLDEETANKYAAHIHAFVNVPHMDERGRYMAAITEEDRTVTAAHEAYLGALQRDASAFSNALSIANPACRLPWDVRHRYMAWSVQRMTPKVDPDAAGRVADRILLGIRRLGPREPKSDAAGVVFLEVDGDRLLPPAGDDPAQPCGRNPSLAVPVTIPQEVPPDILTGVAAALGAVASQNNKKKSVVSKASMRARSVLSTSSANRRNRSSRKSSIVDVITVPITRQVAIDAMRYANAILHPEAPVSAEALETLTKGEQPYQALLIMSKFLQVPVAAYDPAARQATLLEGPPDAAEGNRPCIVIVLHVPTEGDLLLTRTRTKKRRDVFGVLSTIRQVSDPSIALVASK